MSDEGKNAPTWQRLGYEREFLDAVAHNEEAVLDLWWDGPPASPDDVECWASSAIADGNCVFAMGSMGYVMPRPPLDDWRAVGHRVVSAAVFYFHGAWRDKFKWLLREYDRHTARTTLPWSDAYRQGLALALALGDWASAERLLEWPGPDLRWDEGTDDRTEEDNAYQIWLASRLNGEAEASVSPQRELAQRAIPRQTEGYVAAADALQKLKTLVPGADAIQAAVLQRVMIERGARRRPKMLMAAADAMLAGDAEAFAKALAAYLKHYRQKELRTNRADFGVCLDATALWHLARRRGLGEAPLPEESILLIARP